MRRVAAGCCVVVSLGGCATLERGTRDDVTIVSEPPGATVTSTLGVGCAATPCSVTVARDAVFAVTVSKDGYVSQTVAVTTGLSGTGVAVATENVATAGLGLAVDAATGATLEHQPNPVAVTLTSLPAAKAKPTGARPRAAT